MHSHRKGTASVPTTELHVQSQPPTPTQLCNQLPPQSNHHATPNGTLTALPTDNSPRLPSLPLSPLPSSTPTHGLPSDFPRIARPQQSTSQAGGTAQLDIKVRGPQDSWSLQLSKVAPGLNNHAPPHLTPKSTVAQTSAPRTLADMQAFHFLPSEGPGLFLPTANLSSNPIFCLP